jgi:hypothetical protein
MLNFKRFVDEKEVIVPIVKNWGRHKGRKISVDTEDGWYELCLGSEPRLISPASPLEVYEALERAKKYTGLALGNDIVPWNFENLFSKGYAETVKVNFLDQPAWQVVKFAEWEDRRFYFYKVDSKTNRSVLNKVREKFESGKDITDIKGLTPEMRYYFLLLSLQQQSYRRIKELEKMQLNQAEREKRLKEFSKSFAGRLKNTIEQAGGVLVRFSKRGKDKYTVIWKVGKQKIISVIKDDMRIYDAGFCLEGDDKKHSMSSLVVLARTFQEESPLYITHE